MIRSLRPSRILMSTRKVLRNDQLVLGFMALAVGLSVGGAVIGFRELIVFVQTVAWGVGSERLYDAVAQMPWWRVLLVPALGGLVVGLIIHRVMPGKRPQGVAHVMEAAALHGGRMNLRAGLAAALATATSIGIGASVGREGPAVHLGGSLAGWFAARLHLSRNLSRSIMGCGVAAAVAGSFNAPIAGALFAHEVVVGHYALSAFAPVVVASVTATMVSRAWFGDYPAFIIPDLHMGAWTEFPAFAGLGVVSALISVLFVQAVRIGEERFAAVPAPPEIKPALGGLAVGFIALAFPQVLGVGYDITDDALKGAVGVELLLGLLALKIVATALSLGSGLSGGVFAPALVLGALLGGAYGHAAAWVFPHLASDAGVYALVGMGAVASAVLGAPISTTLIMFEMTGDYKVTIAVMLSSVIANVLFAQILGSTSFFHWQLARRGIDLEGGHEARILKSLKASDWMKSDAQTVPQSASLTEVRRRLQISPIGEIFVLCDHGVLVGTVTLADMADVAFDPDLDDLLMARDVARLHPPVVARDESLGAALEAMQSLQEPYLAVVESHDTMVFMGWVHQADLLSAYNRALVHARAEETGRSVKS